MCPKGLLVISIALIAAELLQANCTSNVAPPSGTSEPTKPARAESTPRPGEARLSTPAPTPKAAPDKPRNGGVLNITAYETLGPHYDVHQNTNSMGVMPFQHLYNLVVQYDAQEPEKIVPDLAQNWDASADGTVYNFKLRKGVKWHDGRPFSSADAKASLDRMYNPPKGMVVPKVGGLVAAIKGVEAPDSENLKVTLKYASASFLPGIANGWCVVFPKHVLDEKGDMKRTILGTGPFKFKSDIPDNSFEVVRNNEYFREPYPYLDGIKWYIIKDPATRFAAFRTKRVHSTYPAFAFTSSQVVQLKRELPEVRLGEIKGAAFFGYYFLVTKQPWNDIRVRKAISLAIDRQEAVKSVEQGIGIVAGPIPPGKWALPEDEISKLPGYRQPKDQDRAEAKKLLAEAGYAAGLKLTLLFRQGAVYENAAQFFKEQMRLVGVDVSLSPMDNAILTNMLTRREFDAAQFRAGWTVYDPDDIVLQYYRTNEARNYMGFSDPEVDRLIDEQAKTVDEAKRKEMVNKLQRLLLEKVPLVQSHWNNAVIGWWPEVRNMTTPLSLNSYWRLEDVWLAR